MSIHSSLIAVRLIAMLAAVGVPAAPAHAVQHLIPVGQSWQNLGPKLRPGDEIVLMPGEHRGVSFDALVGAPNRPITIRSADPANPSTILAEREGIRIRTGAHLVIKDLKIVGATINGITVTAGENGDGRNDTTAAQDVSIRNVTIIKTGPRGLRHGIEVRGMSNVRIHDCRFEGWGGSAIELVACDDVSISGCDFKGLADFGQMNGVRARAGSRNVDIESCRFENAGLYSICMGGASNIGDFDERQLAAAGEGTAFEAASVRVQNCLIVGSQCAAAFINADGCSLRNNTIIRPRYCVVSLLAEQRDPRFHGGRNGLFGRNIITWEPGDLTKLVEFGPNSIAETFTFDANLWWSAEDEAARSKLGALPGNELLPQVIDVNPQLGDDHKPANPDAQSFGF